MQSARVYQSDLPYVGKDVVRSRDVVEMIMVGRSDLLLPVLCCTASNLVCILMNTGRACWKHRTSTQEGSMSITRSVECGRRDEIRGAWKTRECQRQGDGSQADNVTVSSFRQLEVNVRVNWSFE